MKPWKFLLHSRQGYILVANSTFCCLSRNRNIWASFTLRNAESSFRWNTNLNYIYFHKKTAKSKLLFRFNLEPLLLNKFCKNHYFSSNLRHQGLSNDLRLVSYRDALKILRLRKRRKNNQFARRTFFSIISPNVKNNFFAKALDTMMIITFSSQKHYFLIEKIKLQTRLSKRN